MVRGSADEGKSKSDIDSSIEGLQLKGNQALVMIESDKEPLKESVAKVIAKLKELGYV